MNPFTQQDLERLLEVHQPPCLSLFMPTHRRPPDAEEDPVRYRNLLTQAEQELAQQTQLSNKELREFFAPLEELNSPDFWVGQLDGLAVFRARDCVAVYQVPFPVAGMAVVADTFLIRPLLPALTSGSRFYVLALSQGDVTLYEGNPHGLMALDLPDLPDDMKDAVGTELAPDRSSFVWHQKGKNPMFAGHGTDANDNEPDQDRYFRIVDRIVCERLKGETAPLVLAAPVDEWHLYRKANHYPHLAEQALDGNHDRDTAELLHRYALPLAAPFLDERRRALLGEFSRLEGSGRATADLISIARAAMEGRVLALLLAEGKHLWGRYNRTTGTFDGEVTTDPDAVPGAGDLLDDLAEETLRRGGEVYIVPPEELPTAGPLAAIFRY